MPLPLIRLQEGLLGRKSPYWIPEASEQMEKESSERRTRESQQQMFDLLQCIIQGSKIPTCPFIPLKQDKSSEFSEIEAEIKKLVEEGNIPKAREEMTKVPAGTSESLDKWKRLLAEPVIKQGRAASGHGMQSDLLWLEKHAQDYRGQWVALKNGRLLGNNPSSTSLEELLEESGSLAGSTFFKVEE